MVTFLGLAVLLLVVFFTAFLAGFFAEPAFFAALSFFADFLAFVAMDFFLLAFLTTFDLFTMAFAAAAMLAGFALPAAVVLLPAVERMRCSRAWFCTSRSTNSRSSSSYSARCKVPSSCSARVNMVLSAGSTSPARNVRIGSPGFLMWASICGLVGALPSGVTSCLRRFCVERIPLLKKADTSPKLSVTLNSLVSPASPQTNIGIGLPLYLPGCAVG